MGCFSPIRAYRSEEELTKNGKRAIKFTPNGSHTELFLPCGQCIGCRLAKSKAWATRCMHEASMHEENSFLTLTYGNDCPEINKITLVKEDFQKFMKKLRKVLYPKKISYYYCGEYGENYSRPHFHALIFGHDFADKIYYKNNKGNPLYISQELNKIWGHGYAWIGNVTFDSAAYVSRYIAKKIYGKDADEYYSGRVPEYTNMSLKPAIGKRWIEKYYKDVYPHDHVIVKEKKTKVPKYYDKFYEKQFPEQWEDVLANREDLLFEPIPLDRQIAKYEHQLLSIRNLNREMETNENDSKHHANDLDRKTINYLKSTLTYLRNKMEKNNVKNVHSL